jgi:cobalt-zinc-cadmium efflux system membrane fusion protein
MKILHITILALLLGTGGTITANTLSAQQAYAADDHGHEEHGDDQNDKDAHEEEAHGDAHEHEEKGDHKEDDEDGHEEKGEHGVEVDGHGHGDEEEGLTEIDDDAARTADIEVSKAGPIKIQDVLTLTGRIMFNRNTTAEVGARFPGIVKSVKVNWGDKVKKGQALASVEANESLKVYSITAPTNGVVLTRNTNVGNVAGEDAIFTIADLSEVWAELGMSLGSLKQW